MERDKVRDEAKCPQRCKHHGSERKPRRREGGGEEMETAPATDTVGHFSGRSDI